MTKRTDQAEHERMVYATTIRLDSEGFSNVKADVKGYEKPDKVWWESTNHEFHVPDLTASKNSTSYYFEVETGDTIFIPESSRQWKTFSNHATHINGMFILVVPERYLDEAKEQVNNLGIHVDDIWEIKA